MKLLLLLALVGCGSGRDRSGVYTGTVEVTDVNVASTVPGRLVEVLVDRGQTVQQGDPLFAVDATILDAQRDAAQAGRDAAHAAIDTLRSQHAAAQAQVALLERESARARSMQDAGVGTDQTRSQVEGQLKVARAQLQAAGKAIAQAEAASGQADAALRVVEKQLADTRVLAPISGVVLSRNREPGEVVGAGASVLTLGDLDHPRLRVYAPLLAVQGIALGTPVEVRLDATPERPFAGRVSWIASEAEFTPRDILTPEERVKQVFAIDIALEAAPGLHPGVPAEAVFKP
jgi:HlyD family secretion protein